MKKRRANNKSTPQDRARMAQDYIASLYGAGKLDPKHGREFDLLVDDVAPKVQKKAPTK